LLTPYLFSTLYSKVIRSYQSHLQEEKENYVPIYLMFKISNTISISNFQLDPYLHLINNRDDCRKITRSFPFEN